MFKGSVTTASFPGGNPFTANLCENGVQLTICNERADRSDGFFLSKPDYYHVADAPVLSGVNVTGFRKPSVTDLYTKAQIDGSQCWFLRDPNNAGTASVNFDTGTKTIELLGGPYIYEDNAFKDSFALFNLLPAMRQGEWGFVNSGTTTTVYVWPRDEASIPGGISYSVRPKGIDLNGASHIEMAHFEVRQISSNTGSEAPVYSGGGEDVHLHHFEVADCQGAPNVYSAITMSKVDDLHMHDFAVHRGQGIGGVFLQGDGASRADWPGIEFHESSVGTVPDGATVTGQTSGASVRILFQWRWTSGARGGSYAAGTGAGFFAYEPENITGTFITGENLRWNGQTVGKHRKDSDVKDDRGDASAVDQSMRGHVHDFVIDTVSTGPLLAFTQKDLAIYRGTIRNAGKQSHSNALTFYQGCHNFLVWGVNAELSDGYLTWQESDSCVIAFTAMSASASPSGGARAIQQQQNKLSELPGVAHGWLGSFVLNTRGVPLPARAADARYGNGLEATSGSAPLNTFKVYNNIHHGSATEDGGAPLLDWDHNINTKGSGTGTGTRGPNDIVVGVEAFYTDPAGGDFSYPSNSAVRTFAAKDWSSLIASFETRWPFVPAEVFTRDMAGAEIDWSNPPIGPTVDLDADYRADPVVDGPVVPPPPPPPPPPPILPVLRSRILRLSVRTA